MGWFLLSIFFWVIKEDLLVMVLRLIVGIDVLDCDLLGR